VRDLAHLYLREPALHRVDSSWEGFQWIDFADADQSIISFLRRADDPADSLVFVCNFTPEPRPGYRVGLPMGGFYRELINSDQVEYGGSGVNNGQGVAAETLPWQSCQFSAPVNLPPLGVIVLKPQRNGDTA
jgi:1,4-alpha-glucan branching enzyme